MVDPIITPTSVGTYFVTKGADLSIKEIFKRLKPDVLFKEIELALCSEPKVIIPTPTLRREYFSQELIEKLIRASISTDLSKLASLLENEELVSLPMKREKSCPYEATWIEIAKKVAEGVKNTTIVDEKYERQTNFLSNQMLAENQQKLQEGVDGTKEHVLEAIELLKKVYENPSDSNHGSKIVAETTDFSDTTVRISHNLLAERVEQLDQQLRDQMDKETERKWKSVLDEIDNHDFQNAITKGEELYKWITDDEKNLSNSVRGRTYLLLAQVALIETKELDSSKANYSKAKEYFEKARFAFGLPISEGDELRLKNFEAKLLFLEGNLNGALELLADSTDPQLVTTHMLICMDTGEYSKGADLVEGLNISEKWCEYAAYVNARIGNEDKAVSFLNWCIENGNRLLERRCRVFISRGRLAKLREAHDKKSLSVLTINEDAKEIFKQVLDDVSPILRECTTKIETGLDAEAVGIAYSCNHILGYHLEAQKLAELLSQAVPVSIEYANAMLRGEVEHDESIAEKLLSEHPNNFYAIRMAIELEMISQKGVGYILGLIEENLPNAQLKEDREDLCRLVVQLTSEPDFSEIERSQAIINELVGEKHFLYELCNSGYLLKDENINELENVLSRYEKDSDYLLDQFRAEYFIKKGEHSKAATILMNLGCDLSDIFLLKKAARVSLNARPSDLNLSLTIFNHILTIAPEDRSTLETLSNVYMQLQGFARASECLSKLRQIDPDNLQYLFNHAQSCVLANDPGKAEELYGELCHIPEAPMEAHVAYAGLLSDLGKPTRAFNNLSKYRDRYWDEPMFVSCYISIAYAANQDLLAQEAFQQLLTLHESGAVPQGLIQPKSLDDFIKFKEEVQQRRKLLLNESLTGKLPWLFIESLLNNVPYWGWRVRTQSIAWFFDSVSDRASFSIYSTNGYFVSPDGDSKTLKRIECVPRGEQVVVDLSALFTLHRLGLLKEAIDYFGHVKIPPSYLTKVLYQSGELQHHQVSRKSDLAEIKLAVEMKKIDIERHKDPDSVELNEYQDNEESVTYRIQDLLPVLSDGRISQSQKERILTIAHKPEVGSKVNNPLSLGSHIVFDLLTLQTLTGERILDVICNTFDKISISESDFERINQELHAFEVTAETRSWHQELWEILRNDSRVDTDTLITQGRGRFDETTEDELDPNEYAVIDSLLLADQEALSLLVDDRVCQNLFLNSKPHCNLLSFGTDALLMELFKEGGVDDTELAQAFLQLVEWRYRFLIVPYDVLYTLLNKFAQSDLQKVACYYHDCMRDPGLFGGLEPTEPPKSMAFRFYQDLITEIARFISTLWLDNEVDERKAIELTEWAMTELVPSLPDSMRERKGKVAYITLFTILNQALSDLCVSRDYARANLCLRKIADGLGASDEEFIRAAVDIVDLAWDGLTASFPEEEEQDLRVMQSRMLRHVIDHKNDQLDSRTAMIMIKNNLLNPIPEPSIPDRFVKIIEDPKHPKRWQSGCGPYILGRRGENEREMVELSFAFLTPKAEMRRASLAELKRQIKYHSSHGDLFLSPQSRRKISDLVEDLESDQQFESISAAIKISDILEKDFFYQLSGLKQSLKFNLPSEVPSLLEKLLTPEEATIEFLLEHPVCSPRRQDMEINQLLNQVAVNSSTMTELLNDYFRLFGHIPLTGKLSLAGIVEAWRAKHVLPKEPWGVVLDWVKDTGSPLACYHAYQLLCFNPNWIPGESELSLIEQIKDVLNQIESNDRWRLRCDLARHYCRHLESLESWADGEYISAYSWWLAESMASVIDLCDSRIKDSIESTLSKTILNTEEIWEIVKLPVSNSSLRYMTVNSTQLWEVSLLCEIHKSGLLNQYNSESEEIIHLKKMRLSISCLPVPVCSGTLERYAFEVINSNLEDYYLQARSNSLEETDREVSTALIESISTQGRGNLLSELPAAKESVARVTANTLYLQSMNGTAPNDVIYKLFSDVKWRTSLLLNQTDEVVELVCISVVELAIHDMDHEWTTYLAHFIASACEDAQKYERKEKLFYYTIVASLATNTVSAVERLLKGNNRRTYEACVRDWRKKIEMILPIAQPWINAKLRAMKSVLYTTYK